ncbi:MULTISPECIES: hypothetical protein [Thermomonosporaceae]|uniref:hypothetical protein n=1 Tax=Thermomonosporaceae TaxID=2012 RepID=UPI00255A8FAA|nr:MULTISPECIES: hypothetical protein [Thermomonosporaceae]MDL4770988.1 hypothetical protein [Actinomadura xylanilytica]
MRRPTGRALRTWVVTSAVVALLGPLAGLLWYAVVPAVRFVVIQGRPLLADPEGQAPIGIDARFALIAAAAGVGCGALAYLRGGRDNDVPLLLGLAVGGAVASVLAWRVGHQIGLGGFHTAVRGAPDGRVVTGPADLRATGVLVFWPLLAVAAYGLLELFIKRLPAGDVGEAGAGDPDEVGGGELDLEPAPPGRDVDRREP